MQKLFILHLFEPALCPHTAALGFFHLGDPGRELGCEQTVWASYESFERRDIDAACHSARLRTTGVSRNACRRAKVQKQRMYAQFKRLKAMLK